MWKRLFNVQKQTSLVAPGGTYEKMEAHTSPNIGEEACERAISSSLHVSFEHCWTTLGLPLSYFTGLASFDST